jgi:hypothetical protein
LHTSIFYPKISRDLSEIIILFLFVFPVSCLRFLLFYCTKARIFNLFFKEIKPGRTDSIFFLVSIFYSEKKFFLLVYKEPKF